MVLTALLAQEAADDTGRTVTLIIVGLLLVAGLLAMLTFWYWRYTDPRKRMVSPVRQSAADTQFGGVGSAVGVQKPVPSEAPPAVAADDGVDEWLRLTGPQGGHAGR